jgi:hypothetical protein
LDPARKIDFHTIAQRLMVKPLDASRA